MTFCKTLEIQDHFERRGLRILFLEILHILDGREPLTKITPKQAAIILNLFHQLPEQLELFGKRQKDHSSFNFAAYQVLSHFIQHNYDKPGCREFVQKFAELLDRYVDSEHVAGLGEEISSGFKPMEYFSDEEYKIGIALIEQLGYNIPDSSRSFGS